jgi:hypothetical protein
MWWQMRDSNFAVGAEVVHEGHIGDLWTADEPTYRMFSKMYDKVIVNNVTIVVDRKTKTLVTNKCTKRVLSSIVTHSYMFRPCWVIFRENFLLYLH